MIAIGNVFVEISLDILPGIFRYDFVDVAHNVAQLSPHRLD